MKLSIFVPLCCCVLGACAVSRTTTDRPIRANTAAAVEQRIEQLSSEIAHLERDQRTADMRRIIRRLRDAWNDYLRARRQGDAIFAEQGITFDSDYYRLQHRLLDAQFAQIRHLHQPK